MSAKTKRRRLLIGGVLFLIIASQSVIPLLKFVSYTTDLQFEFGGGPIEWLLAHLGNNGVRSLAHFGPKADERKIMKAHSAIVGIHDPFKVPVLMEIAKDPNYLLGIRAAAIQALGGIKEVDSLPFFIAILKDKKNPSYLRATAASAAAKSGQPQAEQALLEVLKEPQSDIYDRCLMALVRINPDKYLPVQINSMLDKSIPLKQREEMADALASCPPEWLKPHVDLIKKGLNAVDANGRPEDEIRAGSWRALNNATGEEPPLELCDSKSIREHLGAAFHQKFVRENVYASAEEIRLMVEKKLDSFIVQWHPKNEGAKP
jgi:hypothetical protein